MRVCMVLFGELTFDYRVFREASALASADHQVVLVVSDFGHPTPPVWERFELRRVAVDGSRSLRRSYPAFWRQAAREAADVRADVYHAHDLDSLWPAARAAERCGAGLVYDSHELFCAQSSLVARPWVRAFWQHLERRLIRRVDRVLTVAPAIARRLEALYRLPRPAIVVRNLPTYREPVSGDGLRQALGLVDDPLPLAIYQGGFLTDNGLAELIDAMRRVEAGRLVLLGGGPLEGELRARVSQWSLEERVRFLERVPFPDLHALTCGADIGLCIIKPTGDSFRWSLPNKLFEYLMAGLPVIGGDTPEIRSLVEETQAGVVVDPGAPQGIAAALTSLLQDPGGRARHAAAARQAARRLCWEREAPRLLEAYEDL